MINFLVTLPIESEISLIRYLIYITAIGVEIWLFITILEKKYRRK